MNRESTGGCRWSGVMLAGCMLFASEGFAGDPLPGTQPGPTLAGLEDPALETRAQKKSPTAFAGKKPQPVSSWGDENSRSYFIPVVDILAEEFLLNQYDRHFIDPQVYGSDFPSFRRNAGGPWVLDTDPFSVNQFAHPYQGGIYHGFARSAGLGFWTSMGYGFLGSALWETAGETGPANINDQFTTPVAGSFLGEPLFRMASLLLESGEDPPGFWRELGAAVISPPTGFNRNAYADRFDGVFRSHDPAVYTRLQLGINVTSSVHASTDAGPTPVQNSTPHSYRTGEAIADFTIAYGLPGKAGYTYTRPFDYFHFQFTAITSNVFENILSRGLIYGTDYKIGENYRGVWGIYGIYDYISPQAFRVSTTGAGVGSTGQWWMSRTVAWQGTALASVGYGSAGSARAIDQRDYHSGIAPGALLASRLIFGEIAAMDVTLRDYRVTDMASGQTAGGEDIARADISLTARVFNLHGVTIKYVLSRRDASSPGFADTHQRVDAVSLAYTYLGQTRFGAVDWRPQGAGGR